MAHISFGIACKELKIAQIAQLNQLFQLNHLVYIYGHGFYELSRMLIRKNVNNDISKDSPTSTAQYNLVPEGPLLLAPPPPPPGAERGQIREERGWKLGKYKLNKIDLREAFEPARLSNPKQTLITKTAGHKTSPRSMLHCHNL